MMKCPNGAHGIESTLYMPQSYGNPMSIVLNFFEILKCHENGAKKALLLALLLALEHRVMGLVYTPRIEDLRPRLRIQAPKRRNPAIKRYLGETSRLKKHNQNIKHSKSGF